MKSLLIAFLFIGGLTGCSQPANEPQITIADLQQQLARIQTFIDFGDCSSASFCSYIAYGRKACGGPKGYLAFSSKIDVEVPIKMVKDYTEAEIAYNERTGAISDCSLAQVPRELGCEDGKCIIIE